MHFRREAEKENLWHKFYDALRFMLIDDLEIIFAFAAQIS